MRAHGYQLCLITPFSI